MEQYLDAGRKIMESSLADSTKKQYEGPWKQYTQFCASLDLEPFGEIFIVEINRGLLCHNDV
jgi:hypothetical protein